MLIYEYKTKTLIRPAVIGRPSGTKIYCLFSVHELSFESDKGVGHYEPILIRLPDPNPIKQGELEHID